MNIVPLGDKYLIEVLDPIETTSGGIILPDMAKEEKSEGVIVSVGTGKMLEDKSVLPMRLGIGAKVVFGKFSGDEITVNNKKHRILKEAEILGYYNEE